MFSAAFITLLTINFFSSIGYSLLAPLYPYLAKSKGLDDFIIGIIFASYAISFVSASFFVSYLVNKVGKSRLFKIAIFVEVKFIK
jgi:MFS family permease